jgi:hypothetical protein
MTELSAPEPSQRFHRLYLLISRSVLPPIAAYLALQLFIAESCLWSGASNSHMPASDPGKSAVFLA